MTSLPTIVELPHAGVDLSSRRVRRRDGRELRLTEQEAGLLAYLVERPGTVVGREELLQAVWGYHPDVVSRAPDVAIRRLRVKVERDPAQPEAIRTARGSGWWFEPQTTRACPLVGQDEVWRALLTALSTPGPRVQLTGPPGSGKSALASAALSEDAWTVVLAGAVDLDGLESAIAEALGIPLASGADLAAVLDRGDRLLWLDGIDGSEAAVEQLLRQGSFGVVATGGRSLTSVEVLAVPPLSREAAGALFQLHLPRGFAPDTDRVDRLLEGLDGLPLAIELAARRVATVGASALLAPQGVRYERLQTRRDGRSLGGALRAAWGTLEDASRQALADLALLAQPCSLELAEALLDPELGWAGDVLEELVERGWMRIEQAPEPSYALLDTVRWLAAQEGTARKDALDALIERMEQGHRFNFGTCMAVLAEARARVPHRAAPLALAVEALIGDFLPRERHRQLVGQAMAGETHLEARRRLAERAWRAGDPDALRQLRELQAEARQAGDVTLSDRLRISIAGCRRAARQADDEDIAAIREVVQGSADPKLRLDALRELSELHVTRAEWQQARLALHQALAVDVDGRRTAELRCALAHVALMQGAPHEGLDHARAAAQAVDSGVLGERAWRTLGGLHFFGGNLEGAAEAWQVSLELCATLGLWRQHVVTLGNLGLVAAERGEVQEARSLLEQAVARARELEQRETEVAHLANLGQVLLLSGDVAAARRICTDAVRAAELGHFEGLSLHAQFGLAVCDQLEGLDATEPLQALHAVLLRRGDHAFARRVAAHLGDAEAAASFSPDSAYGRLLAASSSGSAAE